MEQDLINELTVLISLGEGLEDAADKCGHEEELKRWKAAKNKIMKKYNISSETLNKEYKKTISKEYKKQTEKYEKEQEEKKVRDKEFLASMGIFQ